MDGMEKLNLDSGQSENVVVTDDIVEKYHYGSYSQDYSDDFKSHIGDDIIPRHVNVEPKNTAVQVHDPYLKTVCQAADNGGACVDIEEIPVPVDESKMSSSSLDSEITEVDASAVKEGFPLCQHADNGGACVDIEVIPVPVDKSEISSSSLDSKATEVVGRVDASAVQEGSPLCKHADDGGTCVDVEEIPVPVDKSEMSSNSRDSKATEVVGRVDASAVQEGSPLCKHADDGGTCVDVEEIPVSVDKSEMSSCNLYGCSKVTEGVGQVDALAVKKRARLSCSPRSPPVCGISVLSQRWFPFPVTLKWWQLLACFLLQLCSGVSAPQVVHENKIVRNGTNVCFTFEVELGKPFRIRADDKDIYNSKNGRQLAANLRVMNITGGLYKMCYNPILIENGKIHDFSVDYDLQYRFYPIIFYNESCSTGSTGAAYNFQLTSPIDSEVFLISSDDHVKCEHVALTRDRVSCNLAHFGIHERDCLCKLCGGSAITVRMVKKPTPSNIPSMDIFSACCDCNQNQASSNYEIPNFIILLLALAVILLL